MQYHYQIGVRAVSLPSCFCALSFRRWRWRGGGRSAAPAGSIRPGQQLPQDASRRVPERRPARPVLSARVLRRHSAAQRQRGLWLCYPHVKEQAPTWRSEIKKNTSYVQLFKKLSSGLPYIQETYNQNKKLFSSRSKKYLSEQLMALHIFSYNSLSFIGF